ncbi:hypothetical protein CI102_4532 [Trichoderma harzianum]|nr:hypothetical protein CI102_4532 [Trichoderma harzianum]
MELHQFFNRFLCSICATCVSILSKNTRPLYAIFQNAVFRVKLLQFRARSRPPPLLIYVDNLPYYMRAFASSFVSSSTVMNEIPKKGT